MNILSEYEEVLIGNRDAVSDSYFVFDEKGNERIAVRVIRYAIEELLGWDIATALELFNPNYIELMKLGKMVDHIVFPSDVTRDDTEYILYVLYPKYVDYDVQRYTLRVYKKVLEGKMRYPKDYMYGYLGLLRAKICLQESIKENCVFPSVDGLYKFFSSREGVKYLKQKKLYQLFTSFYDTPLEYMHDSMPTDIKDDFLLHNYLFEMQYRNTRLTEDELAQLGAADG